MYIYNVARKSRAWVLASSKGTAMKKILWLSRHELTEAQKSDLQTSVLQELGLALDEVEFVTENVTWQDTYERAFDMVGNSQTWDRLLKDGEVVAVLGVFPPVAMEAVNHRLPMYSPISRQDATIRRDGTKQIEFVHVRWSINLNWRSYKIDDILKWMK